MKIGFIGAGKVGTAFGLYLRSHGYKIIGYYSKTFNSSEKAAKLTDSKAFINLKNLTKETDIIFITTNDDEIENVCNYLVDNNLLVKEKIVVHMSGASTSDVLKRAKEIGCYCYSLHPLQSFANINKAVEDLKHTVFSIEGDNEKIDVIEDILKRTGNDYFRISADEKAIYHAAACVISNYLTVVIDYGLSLFSSIGIDKEKGYKAMLPLMYGTIENIERLGTEKALTGPIARGDINTVIKHIKHLKEKNPDFIKFYKTLGHKTLELAVKGKLKDIQTVNNIKNILLED